MIPSPRARSAIDALGLISAARSGPVPLASVAAQLDLSTSYLEQIFAVLKQGGVVTSIRGPGGGYRLAAAPAAVPLSRVCALFQGGPEPTTGPHAAFWARLNRDVAGVVAERTLAEVMAGASTPAQRTI